MPRGGRRSGKPGRSYENRSDLSFNKSPQPVGNFADSGPYGTGAALERSQQQMPVSGPQPPAPIEGPGDPLQALLGAAGPAPGSLGAFNRPSERPNEPLTHGLSMGPGGGPEVLSNPVARPAMHVLQQMAAQPYASDEIRNLLNILQG